MPLKRLIVLCLLLLVAREGSGVQASVPQDRVTTNEGLYAMPFRLHVTLP